MVEIITENTMYSLIKWTNKQIKAKLTGKEGNVNYVKKQIFSLTGCYDYFGMFISSHHSIPLIPILNELGGVQAFVVLLERVFHRKR